MALSALTLRGAQQRSATTAAEIAAAAYLAWSGIELALERMNTNPNWRSTTMDSAWTAPVTIGPGSLALRVRDPADGDLADSNNEPVLVRSVGVVGSARQILEAQFAPGESPLSCVQVAAWARSGITLSKCTVTCDQIVSTNGSAYADAATLTGTIEAASSPPRA